ncbi:hypothetical protein [Serratia marcescens]|uniref:hypothetical protein n=1 Tax=Serratia marcescens TaxID=615 RepID=UPI0034D5A962
MDSETFKKIVVQNGPALQVSKKPKTLVEAMISNFALANSDINWKFHNGLVFAWLMGSTVASSRLNRMSKNQRSTVPFCEAWGRVAKRDNGKIHINERRFNRWLSVSTNDLEQFYQETLRAIDAMVTYSAPFSVASLYDLAQGLDNDFYYQNSELKQEAVKRFRVSAAEQFLHGQNA